MSLRSAAPPALYRAVRDAALEKIESNARGVLVSSDPEYLHQLRVGLRRLRAALRAFRPILPGARRKRVVRKLRKLSSTLGRARDWDVLLTRVAPDVAMRARASRARRAALDAIRAQKFSRLLQLARALEPRQSAVTLKSFAARSLDRAGRKVVAVEWDDARERHALRIRVKRLRYSCEFFAPAFDVRRTAPYIAALKELQEVLGRLNDVAVGRRLAPALAWAEQEERLLRDLAPAWARFEKCRPFWRARG